MVIVTTAVYWRLNSPLRRRIGYQVLLTVQRPAGFSPYTSSCDFARSCVFSKPSLGPGLCDRPPLAREGLQGHRPSFSRSYGGILPSSLTRVHSIASVFST